MIRILTYCVLMVITLSKTSAERHEVYWNVRMQPRLLVENQLKNKQELVYHVKIGEFMDILCPQTSLMPITEQSGEPPMFDIFNVTKENYDKCNHGGRRKSFIFACNKPERENKLTIKFQTISPSPFGFRFRYCTEYYFVAVSRHRNQPGCIKNSTRIKIVVKCKDDKLPSHETKTSTTTTSTKATISAKLLTTSKKKEKLNEVVHPSLQTPKQPSSNSAHSAEARDNGPGGAGHCVHPSHLLTLLLSFLSIFVTTFCATRTLCDEVALR